VNLGDAATLVQAARERTAQRIAELTAVFDAIVASSDSANLDDEHDPEGATVGFERAQVSALLEQHGHNSSSSMPLRSGSNAAATEDVNAAPNRFPRRGSRRNRPRKRASGAPAR